MSRLCIITRCCDGCNPTAWSSTVPVLVIVCAEVVCSKEPSSQGNLVISSSQFWQHDVRTSCHCLLQILYVLMKVGASHPDSCPICAGPAVTSSTFNWTTWIRISTIALDHLRMLKNQQGLPGFHHWQTSFERLVLWFACVCSWEASYGAWCALSAQYTGGDPQVGVAQTLPTGPWWKPTFSLERKSHCLSLSPSSLAWSQAWSWHGSLLSCCTTCLAYAGGASGTRGWFAAPVISPRRCRGPHWRVRCSKGTWWWQPFSHFACFFLGCSAHQNGWQEILSTEFALVSATLSFFTGIDPKLVHNIFCVYGKTVGCPTTWLWRWSMEVLFQASASRKASRCLFEGALYFMHPHKGTTTRKFQFHT